jgi:hypothetical protein
MGAYAFIPLQGAMKEHMLLGSILGTDILAIHGIHIGYMYMLCTSCTQTHA